MKRAIEKNARILAIFAMVCTAIVGLVHEFTKERIERQEQEQLLATLNSIIAPSTHNNDLYQDCVLVHAEALNHDKPQKAYIARLDNRPVSVALSVTAPDGYNGNIDILIAVNLDGSVGGVRTLKYNETPGLGDKIEIRKSDWITNFANKKMMDDNDSRWKVNKDGGMFDQFTGATITPRAVVKAVKNTVIYVNNHHSDIVNSTESCREK